MFENIKYRSIVSVHVNFDICLRFFDWMNFRIHRTITLKEWEAQCDKNIITAREQLKKSKPMRFHIDTTIKRIIDSMNNQKQATDDAFQHRIDETKLIKTKLETQHSEVCLFFSIDL